MSLLSSFSALVSRIAATRSTLPRLLLLLITGLAVAGCDSDRLLAPDANPTNRTPKASLALAAALVDIRVSFQGEVVPVEPNYDDGYERYPFCGVRLTGPDYWNQFRCADPMTAPAGDYELTVTWHGVTLVTEAVTLHAGDALTRVIELGDRAARVSGRLTQNGQPKPNADVCTGGFYCINTGADGKFAVFVLPGRGRINDREYDALAGGSSIDLGDLDEQVGYVRFDVTFAGQLIHADEWNYPCSAYSQPTPYQYVFWAPCNTLTAVAPSTGALTWGWFGVPLLSEPFTIKAGETITKTADITEKASRVTGTLAINGKVAAKKMFIVEDGYQIQVTTDDAGHFDLLLPRGTPKFMLGIYGTLHSMVIDASKQNADLGVVDWKMPAARALVRYGTDPLPDCRMYVWFLTPEGVEWTVAEQACDGVPLQLPAGNFRLTAEYAGVLLGQTSGVLEVGQSLELDIDASTMLGRVEGDLTVGRRPMPAGRQLCVQPRQYVWACTTTDARGHFALVVPAGGGELQFEGLKLPYNVLAGQTVTLATDLPGDTPSGFDVEVMPVDPVTNSTPAAITFAKVLTAGATTVTTSPFGSGTLPSPEGLFTIAGRSVVVDINTTATFSGTITVCLNYAQLGATGNPKSFRLMHYEVSRGKWVNITTTNNIAAQTICGETSSLSPFTIAQALPVITAPANISVGTDYAVCSASVTAGTASAASDDDLVSVVGARSDGRALDAPYALGTTLISWTATDADALTSTVTQSILVADREKPVLSVPPDITAKTDAGRATAIVAKPVAIATDNCGRASLKVVRADKREMSDPYPLGKTTLEWNAVDDAGNITRAFQTVTVVDAEAPVLIMPLSKTVNATMPTGVVFSFAVKAKDNVGVESTKCDRPFEGVFPIGTTTVTCVASDAARNVGTASFSVTVLGAPDQIVNLIELVSGSPIPAEQRTAMVATLEKALADARSPKLVCHSFDKFVTMVTSGARTTISPDLAAQILADARRIRGVLGCP